MECLRYSVFKLSLVAILSMVLNTGCGGDSSIPGALQFPQATVPIDSSGLPVILPLDGLQPWESLDENGFATSTDENWKRSVSAINADSIFVTGGDRYAEGGDVSDYGVASRVASGAPGGDDVSYSVHRLAMGGDAPGVVSVDANLSVRDDGSPSTYWVGLANYGSGSWDWYGPAADASVRLQPLSGGHYLSGMGNLFVAVVACRGAKFDLVGVSANAVDGTDSTAPAAPTGLQATGITGGVELSWLAVPAADLAGYRVYYRNQPFVDPGINGVRVWTFIEGQVSHILPAAGEVFVRITAVDLSGNESLPSNIVSATPLPGMLPTVTLTTSAAEEQSGAVVTLTASAPGITGALYDFDLDGDGIYELAGITPGTANADTGSTGVIRPRVRARGGGGTMSALGSVSTIISSNIRPVADGYASPAYGEAPHVVTFTGQGFDDDGTIVEYAWDYNGDGTYDWTSPVTASPPAMQTYNSAGTYNTKFRVTDDDGSIDIDTVTVTVYDPEDPPVNIPPVAQLDPDRTRIYITEVDGLDITFDAGASYDPEGGALTFEFDPVGSGTYVSNGSTDTYSHTYTTPGVYQARVRVTDGDGGFDTETSSVYVYQFDPNQALTPGDVGSYANCILVQGNPAVVYYLDGPDDDLYFIRANDANGTSWGDPVLIESANNSGKHCSIAIIGGWPAVAYADQTDGELTYCRADNAWGSAWQTPQTAYTGVTGNVYSSIADVDGRAGIAFYDESPGACKFVRAIDAGGTTWNPAITISPAGGHYCSMAIVEGNPAVAMYDANTLYYTRSSSSTGSAWPPLPTVLDDSGNFGLFANMKVINGNPAIAYTDGLGYTLRYIRATDATGSAWGATVDVLPMENAGYYCSLAEVSGYPVISCMETGANLYFVGALDPLGATWDSHVEVDSTSTGYYTSMVELESGLPGIAYQYYYMDDLMFAHVSLD